MRRGFTILELLVASALLGMLVTILTMIFNQSSIAWRIGVKGVSDLGDIRYKTGTVREIADNAFVWGDEAHRYLGLWDGNGQLRSRACDSSDLTDSKASQIRQMTDWFFQLPSSLSPTDKMKPGDFRMKNVGSGSNASSYDAYTVNVKSGGPQNDVRHYQAIWSYPDDPSEW